MKKISSLTTPSFLVDLDALEKNIAKYQTLADQNSVELFPMLKLIRVVKSLRCRLKLVLKEFLLEL